MNHAPFCNLKIFISRTSSGVTADDEQEPVLVEVTQVAGVQPVTGEGGGGCLGVVPVSLHHVRAGTRDTPRVRLAKA
jgi:hypothetical protein